MTITRFEALGLLPDTERFKIYRVRKDGSAARGGDFDLDGILNFLNSDSYMLGVMVQSKHGPVIIAGYVHIKTDPKKVKRFLERNNLKLQHFDVGDRPWKIKCPFCQKPIPVSKRAQVGDEFNCLNCRKKLRVSGLE